MSPRSNTFSLYEGEMFRDPPIRVLYTVTPSGPPGSSNPVWARWSRSRQGRSSSAVMCPMSVYITFARTP